MSVDNLDKGELFAPFFEDEVRTATIAMSNEQTKLISFSSPFKTSAPIIIVTPTANVKLYTTNITLAGFQVTASAAFTGDIHYHAWE